MSQSQRHKLLFGIHLWAKTQGWWIISKKRHVQGLLSPSDQTSRFTSKVEIARIPWLTGASPTLMDSRHSPGYKAWTNKDQNGKLSKVQPSREEGSTLSRPLSCDPYAEWPIYEQLPLASSRLDSTVRVKINPLSPKATQDVIGNILHKI